MSGKLVICPTPIGNLGDMPPRALEALREADVVYAEDTRVTGKLLSLLGAARAVERLDENLMSAKADEVLERVRTGRIVAYCSDAGMPGVSDPGQRLVAAARAAELPVEVLPGPSAVITAYVASGFTCPRFYFGGFFPRRDGERATTIQQLASIDAVSLFYESPRRLLSALESFATHLPARQLAVCRELTKLHEEVVLGTADKLVEHFEQMGEPRGEIVLVVDAPSKDEHEQELSNARQAASSRVAELLDAGELSRKEIVLLLRDEFGLARNDAYDLVHSR